MAVEELRRGNTEPLARHIENGGAILLGGMHPDDRARLARLVRTGDPLMRGEKRQNNYECKIRDCFLIVRVFYWLGNGYPGFSNTAMDTAFHRAVEDYESNVVPRAPSRTAESLYRHAWKPYLRRYKSGERTPEDESMVHYQSLQEFLLGLKRSRPGQREAEARLSWFYREFMLKGEQFTIHEIQARSLRMLLDTAGLSPEPWRPHLRLYFGRGNSLIDEILFG